MPTSTTGPRFSRADLMRLVRSGSRPSYEQVVRGAGLDPGQYATRPTAQALVDALNQSGAQQFTPNNVNFSVGRQNYEGGPSRPPVDQLDITLAGDNALGGEGINAGLVSQSLDRAAGQGRLNADTGRYELDPWYTNDSTGTGSPLQNDLSYLGRESDVRARQQRASAASNGSDWRTPAEIAEINAQNARQFGWQLEDYRARGQDISTLKPPPDARTGQINYGLNPSYRPAATAAPGGPTTTLAQAVSSRYAGGGGGGFGSSTGAMPRSRGPVQPQRSARPNISSTKPPAPPPLSMPTPANPFGFASTRLSPGG